MINKGLKVVENKKIKEFNLEKVKAEINTLLARYRSKKEELEWADDDWEVSKIQEELDEYANKIRQLKSKIKEFEQTQKEQA